VVEFDRFTGVETPLDAFPMPDALWRRYRDGRELSEDHAARRRGGCDDGRWRVLNKS
jgi:hypothetical protein